MSAAYIATATYGWNGSTHTNTMTPIVGGTTFSTSILETDPWANQRLFKYDHTLHTAYSAEEIREAEAILDRIETSRGLNYYERNMWKLFPGNKKPSNVDFYAKKFKKREDLKFKHNIVVDEIKEIHKTMAQLWKDEQKLRAEAMECKNTIDAIDTLLDLNVFQVKRAFKDDQLAQKKEDEIRKAKILAIMAPSGDPTKEPKNPNVTKTVPAMDNHESRTWKLRTCYKCGELGHRHKHHTTMKKGEYGLPPKPWGSWKSKSPSHNRYLVLVTDDPELLADQIDSF
jgi:hypothetical protein